MMPFALGEAMPERAQRDGCNCPPWVLRCVHREGTEAVLVLADANRLYELHPPYGAGDWREGGYHFGVYFISDTAKLPCDCGCETEFAAGIDLPRTRHKTEAEALDAFHSEEARLLGREASS